MKRTLVMSPGPTAIHPEVRRAMARKATNPDLDPAFFDFAEGLAQDFRKLFATEGEVFLLGGEGILGLEAAVLSFVKPGDRVLCLSNGIYGRGFGDFVAMAGGQPVYFEGDPRRGLEPQALEAFLEADDDFQAATIVHCETPSGITNPVRELGALLKKRGIFTITDSVSALGGEALAQDAWGLDVVLGGSQKCLSAPPGISLVSLGKRALGILEERREPIPSYYANLKLWLGWRQRQEFPYTQPDSLLFALRAALDRHLSQEDPQGRHQILAEGVRQALLRGGLELYPQNAWANTVTTFLLPPGVSGTDLHQRLLREEGLLLGGGWGELRDRVLRIGHMGENAGRKPLIKAFRAMDRILPRQGVPLQGSLEGHFTDAMRKKGDIRL